MKFFKLYGLLGLIFLCACSRSNSMPPKSVGGKEISFYGTFISPKWAKYYHNKKVLVHFADNGTYYAKEGGRTLDRGEYSYVPRKGTHSATLMRSYTTKKGQIHIYEVRLDFNDTASGTWEMLHSSDPDVTVVEKGTFTLIN